MQVVSDAGRRAHTAGFERRHKRANMVTTEQSWRDLAAE
jgi:hypothetical protein